MIGKPLAGLMMLMPVVASAADVELVARRQAGDLVLYLDDYASNTPIRGLQVDVQVDGRRLRAAPSADGSYHLPDDLLQGLSLSSARVAIQGAGRDQTLPLVIEADAPPTPLASTVPAGLPLTARMAAAGLALAVLALVGMRQSRRRRPDAAR